MKKRFLSLMIALAMMVGVFTPLIASADNGNEPVEVPTGKLAAEQLSATKPEKTEIDLYKLTTKENYKPGAPWEHTGGKIEDTTKLGTGVEPLKGAKFTFYKIKGNDDKENEKILALLDKNKTSFETPEDMDNLIKNGKTGLTASDRDANFTEIVKNKLEKVTAADSEGLTNGETAATDADGKATVKLADGYYWAIESVKPDKVTGQIAVPFALTLPLMNGKDVGAVKAGTQYLKKLYIYPKNIQTNDVKIDKNHANYNEKEKKWFDKDNKEVKAEDLGADYNKYAAEKKTISEELGKDRRFDSKTEIPRNYTFTQFSWSDIMSEGLTYKQGSLKVTMDYVDAQGAKQSATFIDLTQTTKVNAGLVTENNNGFDINVVKEGVKNLNQPDTYTASEKAIVKNLIEYLKNGPVEFHFAYSAKVNNNTVVDKPQSNSITFEPGKPDGGGQVKSDEDKIKIDKSWKKNNEEQANPTAQDITYYLLKEGKTVASVTVKAGTAENTVLDAGKGIKFTVGKKLGSGTFSGLEKGVTYTVREAVAGYKPTYTSTTDGKLNIENKDKPEVKKPTEPKIVFHGKKFVKVDQLKHEERLFGAEFVIRNKSTDANNADKDKFLVVKSADKRVEELETVKNAKKALDEKIDAYNNLTAEEQKKQKSTYDTEIDKLQEAYNKAVVESRTEYTWVEGTGTNNATPPENAYKLISDGQGRFEITGLSAGNYELVETKAPVGYAKNESPIPFTVKDGTYTKDESDHKINYNKAAAEVKDALRVDNKKVTIPQTGGIGTIIFTAIGLAIMASAIIAIKKRQATEAR